MRGQTIDCCPSDAACVRDYRDAEIVGKGLANADILKVNDEEMNRLGFVPDDLLARFPRLKIIVETRGALGCRIVSRKGERFDSPAFTDEPVVDTVGAGDSFSAAFLASLLREESLESAAEAASRLRAIAARRVGDWQAPDIAGLITHGILNFSK